MNRRQFLTVGLASAVGLALHKGLAFATPTTPEVAITIDDPSTKAHPLYTHVQCATRLIATLEENKLSTALFVCGKRIDSQEGHALIKQWNDAGHMICNHSYSHGSYNVPSITLERMRDDILRAEGLISGFTNFRKLIRFPFLKEGDTAEKRDAMREWMHSAGYHHGYVSIDASDWAIDDRLTTRLTADPKADLEPYKAFYLEHLWERSQYYNDLALKVIGRPIKHTLLLHHTVTNALFLQHLIDMYRSKGWKVVSASEAYADPIFLSEPISLPAGESLVWALAKATGKYDSTLRYPGEDDSYEKPKMDALKL